MMAFAMLPTPMNAIFRMIRLDSWEEITFQFTIIAQNCDLGMNKGGDFGILLGLQPWVWGEFDSCL
jgi:hypothetical protein